LYTNENERKRQGKIEWNFEIEHERGSARAGAEEDGERERMGERERDGETEREGDRL